MDHALRKMVNVLFHVLYTVVASVFSMLEKNLSSCFFFYKLVSHV